MPPSAGPPKPVKKGQSSGSIIAGKDLTFSFSPEQKVAVREWLGVGMSVLEHQQNKQNDSSSHTTSLGLSSAAAGGVGGALSGSASLILAPSDSRESNPLSMGSFQLDQILAEKGTKNEEQFEQLALRILVRVVLALGHYQPSLRKSAVLCIIQMAEILTEKPYPPGILLNVFETVEIGYAQSVAALFKYIGPAFNLIAMPLLAGLELFQSSSDWKTRTIATAAMSQILWESKESLTLSEKNYVIWSLFFALGAVIEQPLTNPHRLAIVNGLLLLVPLYALDKELASSVIKEIMALSNKSPLEQASIKEIINAIFQLNLQAGKSELDYFYAVLLDLIASQVEGVYDLMSWTVQTFFQKTSSDAPVGTVSAGAKEAPKSGKAAPSPAAAPSTNPDDFTVKSAAEFAISLTNHFKANPAFVRYGAALALNSIVAVQPSFPTNNPHVWSYVVSGITDSDFLTAGLYLQLLESIDFGPDTAQVKQYISSIKQEKLKTLSYDQMYNLNTTVENSKDLKMKLNDLVAKNAPLLSQPHLHKLANALDYLDPKLLLRQLELIRVWGKKSLKLDIYLMKILIPLCSSSSPEIQSEAIQVAEALFPVFSNSSQAEVTYIWSYISKLLVPLQVETATLLAALKLLSSFPIQLLTNTARDEMMAQLFTLSFHPVSEVRLGVYQFLGGAGAAWRTTGHVNSVLGHLLICLGDDDPKNFNVVVDHLVALGSTSIQPVSPTLYKMKEVVKRNGFDRLKVYETISNAIVLSKSDLRPIVEFCLQTARADEIWGYFLGGVPENQLARPEEYNYNRNHAHNPMWMALMYCKFALPPPPLGEGIKREAMPNNPVAKRRYICGYMQILFPSLGNYDPLARKPACMAALLCCFKGSSGHIEMLRGLFEYLTQHLLPSKYATYQVSAIEILRGIVRCKIPNLSESIFSQYLELCFDLLHNSPSSIIQIAVLELLQVFCLVFPKGIQSRLSDIRDLTRPFLADKNPSVVEAATKVYPIIFRCAPDSLTTIFEDYLKAEIIMLTDIDSIESVSDPLLSRLDLPEISRILEMNITVMGQLLESSQRAYEIAHFLINFLNNETSAYRLAALDSIISLLSVMTTHDAASIIWVILPLFSDLNFNVRLSWSRFRRNLPTPMQTLMNILPSHPDDNVTLPISTWEEIFNEYSVLPVLLKALQELTSELEELMPPTSHDIPIEDDGFHLPTISEKLMNRFKQVIASMAGPLSVEGQNFVLYQLEQYRENMLLVPYMNLVLSEFACMHDDVFEETVVVLVGQLCVERDPQQESSIESSIVGIRNILNNSRPMFQPTLDLLMSLDFTAEGELLAMAYVYDLFANIAPIKAFKLITQFCKIASNTKHSDDKRILAVYLATEFSLMFVDQGMKTVCDAIQQFIDSMPVNSTREKLYRLAGRVFPFAGEKQHVLFKSMIVQAKKLMRSKLPHDRMQAISIFRIFAPTMQPEECFAHWYRFLADPDREIREAARNAIFDDKLLTKAWNSFKTIQPETPEREKLLSIGKLPCMNLIGISMRFDQDRQNNVDGSSASLGLSDAAALTPLVHDAFNIKWYQSDHRKMFTKHFGLNEYKFSKCIEPLTTGALKLIETKVNGVYRKEEEFLNPADAALRDLQPLSILRALLPFAPIVAESVVSDLLKSVELFLEQGPPPEDDEDNLSDLQVVVHKIDLLSNLLIAYGSSNPELVNNWLERIKTFISTCFKRTTAIRTTLYADLEKAFYFDNQFADIPIISDEQILVLQELRDITQEAILDVVKSGKTEKVNLIDNRNDQWNTEVDNQGDALRGLTVVALQMLSGYGMYHILTADLSEDDLIRAFSFIYSLIDDEHRGIRYLVVETCLEIVSKLDGFERKLKFKEFVKTTLDGLVSRLEKEYSSLYRRKADIVFLIGNLIHYFEDEELQKMFLKLLVMMLKDGDSEVRQFSVSLIQSLAERKVGPFIEAFKDKSSRKPGTTIDLVQELILLGNNEDYPDRGLLQNLLRWRFSAQNPFTVKS